MSGDRKPRRPVDVGACRACQRVFVDTVEDPLTQCIHDGGGYCQADAAWKSRNGVPPEKRYVADFPPGHYRDPVPTETAVRSLNRYVQRRRRRLLRQRPVV